VEVNHDDRDVEFILLKKKINKYIAEYPYKFSGTVSCEMMARALMENFNASFVEVSEDGENGARLDRIEIERSEPTSPSVHAVQSKCFVGIEAEGPYRGTATLFIPGKASIESIRKAMSVINTPIALYYGAGNDRNINPDTLAFLSHSASFLFTIETDLSHLPIARIDSRRLVVLFLEDKEAEPPNGFDFSKRIVDGNLIWVHRVGSHRFSTPTDDFLFSLDKYIE